MDIRDVTEGMTQPLKPFVLGNHMYIEFRKVFFAEGVIGNGTWLGSGS